MQMNIVCGSISTIKQMLSMAVLAQANECRLWQYWHKQMNVVCGSITTIKRMLSLAVLARANERRLWKD